MVGIQKKRSRFGDKDQRRRPSAHASTRMGLSEGTDPGRGTRPSRNHSEIFDLSVWTRRFPVARRQAGFTDRRLEAGELEWISSEAGASK